MNARSSRQTHLSLARAPAAHSLGTGSSNAPGRLDQAGRRGWTILQLSVKRFLWMGGDQWAGAFAYFAFLSLFPVIVLFVTVASALIDRDRAGKEVIAYVESYVPISGEMQRQVFDTVAGVVDASAQAGVFAILVLVWVALQFFSILICTTNRAWGTEMHNWWRLPVKSLVLLGVMTGAVLAGIAAPVLAQMAEAWLFPAQAFRSWVYDLASFFLPWLVLFISLSLFYRLAPRRRTRFAEVWAAALCATVLLRSAESLFVIYLKHFARLNVVYGAFGGIMALLLWVYLSGCIFIFGACLCAAQAETLAAPANTNTARPGWARPVPAAPVNAVVESGMTRPMTQTTAQPAAGPNASPNAEGRTR